MLPRHLLAPTLLTVACLVCPSAVSAQSGRVNGIVRGENGDAVKGATITAEMPSTGMNLTATTDDKGRFIMIGLRPGVWRFIAQSPLEQRADAHPQSGLSRVGSLRCCLCFTDGCFSVRSRSTKLSA